MDYTEPVTLKYFALWLWLTEREAAGRFAYGDTVNAMRGPIDWSAHLDAGLLALPGFANV